jgi:hypothetical protein
MPPSQEEVQRRALAFKATDEDEKLAAAMYPSMRAKPTPVLPAGTTIDEQLAGKLYTHPTSAPLFDKHTTTEQVEAPDPKLIATYPTMFTEAERAAAASGPVDAAVLAQVSAWENEIRGDPEIGGANLEKSLEVARSVLKDYGGPELTELLEAGIGSHPAMVKSLVRIGKALKR